MASTSGGGGQHGSTTSTAPSSSTCFTFHLVFFLIYLYIFCWHFSEQASTMPQAWEFGWYFKAILWNSEVFYILVVVILILIALEAKEVVLVTSSVQFLTFCGFAFQMVALVTSFITHLMPEVRMLKRTANDMSCAGFEIANATTLVYWTVIFWTSDPVKLGWRKAAHKTLHQGLVEGVPLWLSLVTNIGNAGVAWADLLITERTFRRSSLYITILFMVVNGFWAHVCEARNEDFPHPFAKPLRQPDGSIIVSSLAFAFVFLFHTIGSWLASRGTSPLPRKIKLV